MTASLRIRGLVRSKRIIAKRVRDGVEQHERSALAQKVATLVTEVERICREHDTSPFQLPAPSRNAYLWLRSQEPARWPSMSSPAKRSLSLLPPPPKSASRAPITAPKVRIGGLVAAWTHVADAIWRASAEVHCEERVLTGIAEGATAQKRATDRILERHQEGPEALPTRSRRAYAALSWATCSESLRSAVRSSRLARSVARELPRESPPVRLYLENMRALWSRRTRDGQLEVRINLAFALADEATWRDLVQVSFGQGDADAKARVRAAGMEETFVETLRRITGHEGEASTRGSAHDLRAAFERVNDTYFEGAMPRPSLLWSPQAPRRRVGSFEFARDRLVVSRVLDHPAVPEWVVDFVVYHELLHKKHGVTEHSGRSIAHTAAFRRDEQRFERFAEAEAYLASLA